MSVPVGQHRRPAGTSAHAGQHRRPAEPPPRGDRRLLVLLGGGALLAVLLIPVLSAVAGAVDVPASSMSGGVVLRGRVLAGAVAAVVLTTLVLLTVGLSGRSPWRYPDDDRRDLRLDLVRGVAIVFVVLNHVNLPSLFQLVSQEAVGPVSGAELFVALSGVVLGTAYRSRIARTDLVDATGALLGRAFTLYKTALVVVLTVFLLTLLPGVDGRVVTTFTDQSSSQTYGLYPNIERLLDYPVPGYVLRDILLLRLGPFQFNIMGLYVVLLAVTPLLLAALRKRLVLLMLAGSWLLYAAAAVRPTVLLGTQFEDPFPLLTWQVLFVHGLAAGWYRAELLRWCGTRAGKAVVAAVVLAHLGMVLFTWSNPVLSHAYDLRLGLLPDETFTAVYDGWFGRPDLELGRLVDVGLLLVTAYAALTAFWTPLHRALGWFLVPLGQATLYVFVLHVFVALVVANVPGLDRGNVWLGTLAHAVALLTLWGMVRHRVLFRIVPR